MKSNELIRNNTVWTAIYTRPKYEKKVHDELLKKGLNSFLPLHKQLHQWSDRKKWVELPLFFNYVFVQISQKDYLKVLNTSGVVNFISFENKIAHIPDSQIDVIKRFLDCTDNIETLEDSPEIGEDVEITAGPLMGIKGNLFSFKGKKRVGVNIEYLNKTLLIEIASSYIRSCN